MTEMPDKNASHPSASDPKLETAEEAEVDAGWDDLDAGPPAAKVPAERPVPAVAAPAKPIANAALPHADKPVQTAATTPAVAAKPAATTPAIASKPAATTPALASKPGAAQSSVSPAKSSPTEGIAKLFSARAA